MPIKHRYAAALCLTCGTMLIDYSHRVEDCLRGHVCRQLPYKAPDNHEISYRTVLPSTGQMVEDTGSTRT